MEVIFDKMNEDEFFKYGGVLKLKTGEVINDPEKVSDILPDDIDDAYIGANHYKANKNGWAGFRFIYDDQLDPISLKDPYNMPNLNFTVIDRNDQRWESFKKQRLERGFDDSELWNLDTTLAKFIYPRLKAFKEDNYCWPGADGRIKNAEDWNKLLDIMIYAFESIIYKDDLEWDMKKIRKGLRLFSDYFLALWT